MWFQYICVDSIFYNTSQRVCCYTSSSNVVSVYFTCIHPPQYEWAVRSKGLLQDFAFSQMGRVRQARARAHSGGGDSEEEEGNKDYDLSEVWWPLPSHPSSPSLHTLSSPSLPPSLSLCPTLSLPSILLTFRDCRVDSLWLHQRLSWGEGAPTA